MFADKTLMPKEAMRLAALGILAGEPLRYSHLAEAVRHFTSRIMGPSLDLMHTSIELLKYEGLVEPIASAGGDADPLLRLTEDGWAEFKALLAANVRSPANDLNKLVMALKFRFLHFLSRDEQRAQADLLMDKLESELARLEDLREAHEEEGGHLVSWLDLEIGQSRARLLWLKDFREAL